MSERRANESGLAITVAGPRFYSRGDEDVFFNWLTSLPGIAAVEGIGSNLVLRFRRRRVAQRDIRELRAIFHRYALDERHLAIFGTAG
jgi:hypothetical protein